jgi:Ca2+-binding RTX toxin-like protein
MADITGTEGDDTLTGTSDTDTMYGSDGNDDLSGRQGDDLIKGGADDDVLWGNDGNDKLYGNKGNDYLIGGNGDDKLVGFEDYDQMVGGNGRDLFQFGLGDSTATREGADLIRDFDQAEHDVIRVMHFSSSVAWGFIGTDAFSGAAGEVRYEQAGLMTYIEADRDGDGHSDLTVALLGSFTLTADDLYLM